MSTVAMISVVQKIKEQKQVYGLDNEQLAFLLNEEISYIESIIEHKISSIKASWWINFCENFNINPNIWAN